MAYLFSIMTLALAMTRPAAGVGSAPASADTPSVVQGRIELLNPKAKLREGGPDAGGVAVWLTPLKQPRKSENFVPPKVKLEQKDKRFIPHVLVVQVGTEVDFPNSDLFFHNVFSLFNGKVFDLGLYAKGESRPVRFDRPGISYIYCNIHPQMSAVILTVDTPHFGVSAPDGSYSIRNVPAGDHQLHIWHERSDAEQLEALSRVLSIGSGVVDVGTIRLDEAKYIPMVHKDKHGEDYPGGRELPAYRRP